jgi:hypothetical protein
MSKSKAKAEPAQEKPLKRSSGKYGFILLLALVAAMAYLAATFVPTYLANRGMQEAADEIIRRGALQNLSDPDIRAQLNEKVREYGLPSDTRIELRHEGKGLKARIIYQQTIRFPFYNYPWPVEIQAQSIGF